MPEKYKPSPEVVKKLKMQEDSDRELERELEREKEEAEKEEMMTDKEREERELKRQEEWEKELAERRKQEIEEARRMLEAVKKMPDSAFLLVNYQYKSRPENDEELLSKRDAIAFLGQYVENPGNIGIYHGFNRMEILSVEEGRKYKEQIEEGLRLEREADEREKAKETNRLRLLNLRILPRAELTFALQPELEQENSLGISAAMRFVDTLKKSVENPADFIGDQSQATGLDKITYEGWTEHKNLKHAFQHMAKVESRVSRGMASKGKKHYDVEVVFSDKDGKELMTIKTTFNEEGELVGGIGMSMP